MKRTTTGRALGMSGCTQIHQRLVAKMLCNFVKMFPKYEDNLLTDTNVIDRPGTKGRRFPDLSLWEYIPDSISDDPQNVLMTVEITHTSGNDEASIKTIEMTFGYCQTLREAFLYNYKKDQWIRYHRVGTTIRRTEDDDYSQVLKIHLSVLQRRKKGAATRLEI